MNQRRRRGVARKPPFPDLAKPIGDRPFQPASAAQPSQLVADPALAARLDRLDVAERAAFAELLVGSLRKHIFYAVRAENPVVPPDPGDPECAPVLIDFDPSPIVRDVQPGLAMTATVEGVPYRRPLPELGAAILRRIDGTRTLAEIHADVTAAVGPVAWPEFAEQFARLPGFLDQVLSPSGKVADAQVSPRPAE